ncbi:hypothetical protein [Streptomyces cucumeris]|uniref:hypothetical protein n=1 Tax=Streptomyces cucumeris TaxID=2962890 RepID=UPI003D712B39
MDRRRFLATSAGALGAAAIGQGIALGSATPAAADDGRLADWFQKGVTERGGSPWTDEAQGITSDGKNGYRWVTTNADADLSYKGIWRLNGEYNPDKSLIWNESWWPDGNTNHHIGAPQHDLYHGNIWVPIEHGPQPRVWCVPEGLGSKGNIYNLGHPSDSWHQNTFAWCSPDQTPSSAPIRTTQGGGGLLYTSQSSDHIIYGYKMIPGDVLHAPYMKIARTSRLPHTIDGIAGGFVMEGRLYLSIEPEDGSCEVRCYRFGRRNTNGVEDLEPMTYEGTYVVPDTGDGLFGNPHEAEGLCYDPKWWGTGDTTQVSVLILDQHAIGDDSISIRHLDMPHEVKPGPVIF